MPTTPRSSDPRTTGGSCDAKSAPCAGESPLTWQLTHRGCRRTRVASANSAPARSGPGGAASNTESCRSWSSATGGRAIDGRAGPRASAFDPGGRLQEKINDVTMMAKARIGHLEERTRASLVSPHAKDKARVLAHVQKWRPRPRPISCRSARSKIYAVDRSAKQLLGNASRQQPWPREPARSAPWKGGPRSARRARPSRDSARSSRASSGRPRCRGEAPDHLCRRRPPSLCVSDMRAPSPASLRAVPHARPMPARSHAVRLTPSAS
jgi:hypothetical protein